MVFIVHKASLKVRISLTTQPRFASFHAVYVTPVEIGISRDCILVIYFILFLLLFYIFMKRGVFQELELRIETQKQTLQARDESIKKLLEMLQSKGVGKYFCITSAHLIFNIF